MVGVAQHAVGPIDVRDVRVALRVKVDIGVKARSCWSFVDGLHVSHASPDFVMYCRLPAESEPACRCLCVGSLLSLPRIRDRRHGTLGWRRPRSSVRRCGYDCEVQVRV